MIGTSLHVRILACAYGIPRVSLSRTKPTIYARTWDPEMPYDVSLDGLDEAVAAALASADQPEVVARSTELTRLAHENLADLAARVMSLIRTDTDEDRALRRTLRHQHEASLLASRAARGAEVARLELELRRTRTELAKIRSSRTYRLATRGARVSRAIRRSLRRAS